MTSKDPAKTSRQWTPSDRLSIDRAVRNDQTNPGAPVPTKPLDDGHLAHPARGQHPITPKNSKPFNRQKKG